MIRLFFCPRSFQSSQFLVQIIVIYNVIFSRLEINDIVLDFPMCVIYILFHSTDNDVMTTI